MNKKLYASVLLLSLVSMNSVFAGSNFNYEKAQPVTAAPAQMQPVYPQNNTLQGNVVMVPAGTTMKVGLTSELSSETAYQGQTVSVALNSDFYFNNKLIAPAGSTVYGTVIEVNKAKHGSMNGKLCVRFNQIYTPFGSQIPISAVIKTDDSSGVLVGGTKMDVTKEYAKDIAVGTAAGALSGVVFGALAGGSVGRGAALGTAVGAGGGLVKSVWDKGNDVVIPAGASFDILLTQPISVSSYHYEN